MVLRTDANKTTEKEAKLLTNWDSNYWWHTNGVNRSWSRPKKFSMFWLLLKWTSKSIKKHKIYKFVALECTPSYAQSNTYYTKTKWLDNIWTCHKTYGKILCVTRHMERSYVTAQSQRTQANKQ
jgi:hypothetical protein